MKKQQVIFIHGGEVHDAYEKFIDMLESWEYEIPDENKVKKWKYGLSEIFPDMEFIYPQFPNALNAKYREWKIWFEKVLEKTDEELVFIGHSLGGTFLLKYFSENKTDKKIKALFLVSAAIISDYEEYQLDTFTLDFEKVKNLDGENIIAFHSRDDYSVPFADFEKLSELLPSAEKIVLDGKGHFLQEEFPEIVEKIKELE